MCKCLDDDNELIRRHRVKTFQEWGRAHKNRKLLPWRAKEWAIPSPHTRSTNPNLIFKKQAGLNLTCRLQEKIPYHMKIYWVKKIPFHCIIQQIRVILEECAAFRSCISSCSHSGAFCLKVRAQTQTTANYFSYDLERFPTYCTMKMLQLCATCQGWLHAHIYIIYLFEKTKI